MSTLLVGIVMTSWQAWEATSERNRTKDALLEVGRERCARRSWKPRMRSGPANLPRRKARRADRLRPPSRMSVGTRLESAWRIRCIRGLTTAKPSRFWMRRIRVFEDGNMDV